MTAPAGHSDTVVESATCLGCGCACDDITVVVRGGRIAEARATCALGRAWFGDGTAPARALVGGRERSADAAIVAAAQLLDGAERPMVVLAPELSCEAQRTAVAIADRIGAFLDTVTTSTAGAGILAGQRRGRATATLGEIRHRADVLVFWGVDPDLRYPRYTTRYAPLPRGMHIGGGREARRVIAVDVGGDRGPADADDRLALDATDELDAIADLRMRLKGRAPLPMAGLGVLAERLLAARYAVIVYDAEPSPGRDPGRAEALLALVQELNGPTRAALSALRAGGNRSGADAVVGWQTGFPMAVDFSGGGPRYAPYRAFPERDEADVVLIAGRMDALPGAASVIHIGPFATAAVPPASVAIDGGVAGIHESGMAVRMDDVPLPLRLCVAGPPSTAGLLETLGARLGARRRA